MVPRFHFFIFVAVTCLILFGINRQYDLLSARITQIGQEKESTQTDTAPSQASPPKTEYIPTDSATSPYCKWVFDRYESSEYEEQWFREVPHVQSTTADGANICKAIQKHVEAAKSIIRRTITLASVDSKVKWTTLDASPGPLAPEDEYMSRMHYRRVCYDEHKQIFQPASGSGIQLIEPLFGMLRDPFDGYCGKDKLIMDNYPDEHPGQSKLHILPQGYAPFTYTTKNDDIELRKWYTHGVPPWYSSLRPVYDEQLGTAWLSPQNIHLDLGSSYFGGWTRGATAASGQWFYDKYHARGQKFDRFIAVEVEILNDTQVYEQVPEDLIGIYTLMNVGLTMGGDKLNTLNMIKRLVHPEDFLVFKLDIDSAPIEEPIVQSLLADDPENGSALIDELMFEHHVNFYPMNSPWGLSPTSKESGDLLTSYNLFRDLRKKGIRAHSWP
ncbi:uncharacterized protein E0L32_002419 [Thyridium curvatum]|uniref:Uncharacterized protein n=1 Tax=Thyridium curvatum TaxID=1093900 RepID=A0A507B8A9_9PEZI|nr:uncharacterized protein E0L32_002419 [Thyridium curvatum]TPX18562.1 hypothetical protein E0L32_002419 [Thyridium curvatum]